MDNGAGGKIHRPVIMLLSDRVNKICEIVLFIFIFAMIITTTMQVIFRFFFQALSWSEEITRFLLVWSSLIGAAIAFKRGSHIAVTFVIERFPPALRKLAVVITHILGVIFFFIVLWYGIELMIEESTQTSPALNIPMPYIYSIYPIMGAVIILHLASGLMEAFGKESE